MSYCSRIIDVSEKSFQGLCVEMVVSSLASSSDVPKLLLHVCCAPCATSVLEYLLPHFNIMLLFYNPNIQPMDEYNKRATEVERLLSYSAVAFDDPYDEERVRLIVSDYCGEDFEVIADRMPHEPEGGARCRECIGLRLEKTGQLANLGRYDYFATTLSVSPHKNAALINEVGCILTEKYCFNKTDPLFLCADFKKRGGYMRAVELSKQLGLYRQNYCGCRRSKVR